MPKLVVPGNLVALPYLCFFTRTDPLDETQFQCISLKNGPPYL